LQLIFSKNDKCFTMLWLNKTRGAQKSEARRRAYAGGPDWTSLDHLHAQTFDSLGRGLFGGGEVSGANSISRMGVDPRAHRGTFAECQRHLREGTGATADESDGGTRFSHVTWWSHGMEGLKACFGGGMVATSHERADTVFQQVPATAQGGLSHGSGKVGRATDRSGKDQRGDADAG